MQTHESAILVQQSGAFLPLYWIFPFRHFHHLHRPHHLNKENSTVENTCKKNDFRMTSKILPFPSFLSSPVFAADRTLLHKPSQCVRSSGASVCNILVRQSWIPDLKPRSTSVSNIPNNAPESQRAQVRNNTVMCIEISSRLRHNFMLILGTLIKVWH